LIGHGTSARVRTILRAVFSPKCRLGYGPFMEWERTHRRLEEAERRGTRRKVRTRQGRRDAAAVVQGRAF